MKNIVSYKVRLLLRDQAVQNLLIEIIKKDQDLKEKITIFPAKINSCLNSVFSDDSRWNFDNNPNWSFENAISNCFDNFEFEICDQLHKEKIIRFNSDLDESDSCVFHIEILNLEKFLKITKWLKESRYIINYGFFSLNRLTGEAYFMDNSYKFKPGTGYYNLFKKFLVKSDHQLLFSEIYSIQQKTNLKDNSENHKSEAIEIIKEIKQKLQMKDGFGELFKIYEGEGYILRIEK